VTKNSNEREGFSLRLQQTLRNAHHSPDSPTELARDFNARFEGPPITVHAARKWLVGEAIPTQDKLRTLADWLGVPVDWLRFGGEEDRSDNRGTSANGRPEDMKLLSDLRLLSEGDRQIVREFVRILIRTTRERQSIDGMQNG
jgi:transcriptional regulator with XRE-family HTH domain